MHDNPPGKTHLSIIIPMYDEAGNVAAMLEDIHRSLDGFNEPWELICVDDGSSDGTGRILREEARRFGPHIQVIQLRRNFGQTAAMQAGIHAARGELIATLDGDLQNDPTDIPRMIEELRQRELDLLSGWRRNRKDKLLLRRFPSKLANWLIAKVTGVHISDYGCSLKIYRAEVIKNVRLYGEMHRFIPVWVAAYTNPNRIGETVVNHRPRVQGRSKYTLSRVFRVTLDLMVVFFFLKYHARPSHFFGSIGLLFGAIGGAIMSYLLFVKFGLGEDIGGRPLFFVGILLLVASVQFLTTGVLTELLSRTFFESSGSAAYNIAWQTESEKLAWHLPEATNIPDSSNDAG